MVLPATASSSPRRVGVKTLGVILPDDGPFDYEWLRLDGWLVDLGLGYIDLRVERSQADGIVAVTNLHHIGSPDVLLPPLSGPAPVVALSGASTSHDARSN